MASILLIGLEGALLEGVAQTLAAAGHSPRLAGTVAEGMELATREPPLVALVERELAEEDPAALRIPVANGGGLVLYRVAPDGDALPFPAGGRRLVIAEVMLPLERHRVTALVQRVAERQRASGRDGRPPEAGEPRAAD